MRCLIPRSFGQKRALTVGSRYMLEKDGLCSLKLVHPQHKQQTQCKLNLLIGVAFPQGGTKATSYLLALGS